MHRLVVAAAALALLGGAPSPAAQSLIRPDIERKIDALLARMTIEEKVGQLNQVSGGIDASDTTLPAGAANQRYEEIRQGLVGSLLNVTGAQTTRRVQQLAVEGSRLHIPLLFGLDVLHGYRTLFPVPLAEAASWDLEAIERSARVAASEAAAAGIAWTFAPMVDITHDARWGRVVEGAGEDPYLGARVAAARVRGFQGTDLAAPDTVAACAKHLAAGGFAEGGRDYNTVEISEQTLRNVVLPPFKAAVDAGVATVMTSFNDIGGIPSTANAHLLNDILKGEWAFPGLVVAPWASVNELVTHGYAEDPAAAARAAFLAGADMDMVSQAFVAQLAGLVRSGAVPRERLDDAVRRVLRVKFLLGLFDDPYRYSDAARELAVLSDPTHIGVARDVARRSIVLLKNESALLPLDRAVRTIAVVGPLADDKDSPLGRRRAQGQAASAVSLLEGVKAAVSPATRVIYAEGAPLVVSPRRPSTMPEFNTTDRSGLLAAVEAAREADVVVVAVGEDCYQTGEGRSQVDISLKGLQQELLTRVLEVNKRTVVVLMNGRPLALDWLAAHAPTIVETWFLGSAAGHAIADVLFGAYNPSGKLPISFPRVVGQVPVHYDAMNTGRPGPESGMSWSRYADAPNAPLYPFGFGLSYTTFSYSEPRLSATEIARDGDLRVAVTVTNTGQRAGTEVAQLYVRDLAGSLARPVKELKDFSKVDLQPGQSREVVFTLRAEDLEFYTAKGRREVEPGEFKVFVGGNSRDVKEGKFRVR